MAKIAIDKITVDREIQPRAQLNSGVVNDYAEAIERKEQFPPLVVFDDGTDLWLAEGFHRIAAHKKAGQKKVHVQMYVGTRREAMLHAAGSNVAHGLRRTNADKRRAVNRLLDDPEWKKWNDSKIARRCGVSDKLVADIRNSRFGNPNGETRNFDTRHGTVGQFKVKSDKAPAPTTPSETKPADTETGSSPESPEHSIPDESDGFDDTTDDAETANTNSDSPINEPEQSGRDRSPDVEGNADDSGSDFSDNTAESKVRTATEAIEQVVALGDELAFVPDELRKGFHIALRNIFVLWRSLFPVKGGSKTSSASE